MAANEVIIHVRGDTAQAERAMGGLRSTVKKVGSDMGQVGRSATMLAAPILAAAGAGIKAFIGFDDALAKTVALVGIGREQVDQWGEQIKDLAPAVGIGPTKLAEALFDITSGGLRGQEAMDALTASAKASVIGLGETANVGRVATAALNAYAGQGLTAAKSTSILVATVREGQLSAESLATSIGRVLPIASEMGVGLDQVGAAMAAMTRLGANAEEAATALRSTLNTLLQPTSQAEKELAKIGVSAGELRKQLKEEGLLAVLSSLKAAFEGNETAMARVFPNVRALQAVLALTGSNAGATQAIFESLAKTTSEDLDQAFEDSQTSGQNLRQALADIQVALVEVGDELSPILEKLPGLTTEFGDFIEQNPDLVKALAGTAGILAGVGIALFGISAILPALILLWGPFGLAILGVGVLTVAALEAYKLFTGELDGTGRHTDAAVRAFGGLITQLGPVGPLVSAFIAARDTILPVLDSIIDKIGDVFNALTGGDSPEPSLQRGNSLPNPLNLGPNFARPTLPPGFYLTPPGFGLTPEIEGRLRDRIGGAPPYGAARSPGSHSHAIVIQIDGKTIASVEGIGAENEEQVRGS